MQAGIVPYLKDAIIPEHVSGGTEPGPRAPLALPMLCAMALSMSRLCRAELYKNDGVQVSCIPMYWWSVTVRLRCSSLSS